MNPQTNHNCNYHDIKNFNLRKKKSFHYKIGKYVRRSFKIQNTFLPYG